MPDQKRSEVVLILAHERSLNKAWSLINYFGRSSLVILVTESWVDLERYDIKYIGHLVKINHFDISIVDKLPQDPTQVYSVSENLLDLQARIENHFNIQNLSIEAAKSLSNKWEFNNYCRSVGLGEYMPDVWRPQSINEFANMPDLQYFTKPDIGTGSFGLLKEKGYPDIEYKVWRKKKYFFNFIQKNNFVDCFFEINQIGLKVERYNLKTYKIIFEEYCSSDDIVWAPCGIVIDGELRLAYFIKILKISEANSNFQFDGNIGGYSVQDKVIWTVPVSRVPLQIFEKTYSFLERLITSLKVKNLFFSGPDFFIKSGVIKGIDFNPRIGHLFNLIDKALGGELMNQIFTKKGHLDMSECCLWGAIQLQPGRVISYVENPQLMMNVICPNRSPKVGSNILTFQSLQNRGVGISVFLKSCIEENLLDEYQKMTEEFNKCYTSR